MTKSKAMWIDIVDRTRELLCDAGICHSEIAYLTGLDKEWIDRFKNWSDDELVKVEEVSFIAKLHDWLIVLEVARPAPRLKPDDLFLSLGESAVYLYRNRQQNGTTGIFPMREREDILHAAEARLGDMRRLFSEEQ